jgi:hypothetical protein
MGFFPNELEFSGNNTLAVVNPNNNAVINNGIQNAFNIGVDFRQI